MKIHFDSRAKYALVTSIEIYKDKAIVNKKNMFLFEPIFSCIFFCDEYDRWNRGPYIENMRVIIPSVGEYKVFMQPEHIILNVRKMKILFRNFKEGSPVEKHPNLLDSIEVYKDTIIFDKKKKIFANDFILYPIDDNMIRISIFWIDNVYGEGMKILSFNDHIPETHATPDYVIYRGRQK